MKNTQKPTRGQRLSATVAAAAVLFSSLGAATAANAADTPTIDTSEVVIGWNEPGATVNLSGLPANVKVGLSQSQQHPTQGVIYQGYVPLTPAEIQAFTTDANGNASLTITPSMLIRHTNVTHVDIDDNGNPAQAYRQFSDRNLELRFNYSPPNNAGMKPFIPGSVKVVEGNPLQPSIAALPNEAYVGETLNIAGTGLVPPASAAAPMDSVFAATLSRPGIRPSALLYSAKYEWNPSGIPSYANRGVADVSKINRDNGPLQTTDSLALTVPVNTAPGQHVLAAGISDRNLYITEGSGNPRTPDPDRSNLAIPRIAVPDADHRPLVSRGPGLPGNDNMIGLVRDITIRAALLDTATATKQFEPITVTGSDYTHGDIVTVAAGGSSTTATVGEDGRYTAKVPTTADTPVGMVPVTATAEGAPTRTSMVQLDAALPPVLPELPVEEEPVEVPAEEVPAEEVPVEETPVTVTPAPATPVVAEPVVAPLPVLPQAGTPTPLPTVAIKPVVLADAPRTAPVPQVKPQAASLVSTGSPNTVAIIAGAAAVMLTLAGGAAMAASRMRAKRSS